MKPRRKPFFINIWWVLALVIGLGFAANYFFISKNTKAVDLTEKSLLDNDMYNLLNIQTWQTSQGLNVFFLPIENLPIVDVQFIFTAGSAFDGATPGIAQLTNQLIAKDTSDFTTDAIAEQFEMLGALFSTYITRDAASITLRTLSFDDERNRALQLFTHVISAARFTENSLSLEKEQLLTAIAAQAQSPQAQANQAFYQNIYANHPYGTPVIGNMESIRALSLADVTAFYQRFYNINNSILVLSGDVTREEAEIISQQIGAALPQGEIAPEIPAVSLPAATLIEHVNFPSKQKHILLGLPSVEKGNADFFAFYVGNEILGGAGLSSQLFEVVREQEGLAYSIRSQILPLKQKGPFMIALQTRNDSSDIALALVQDHLSAFIENGPTQDELNKAKKNISGQFLMAFNSNAAIAQHVATLAFYHLPMDYYDHYLAKINAVTTDDIKRVFKEYVGSQNLVTVTLGVDEQ